MFHTDCEIRNSQTNPPLGGQPRVKPWGGNPERDEPKRTKCPSGGFYSQLLALGYSKRLAWFSLVMVKLFFWLPLVRNNLRLLGIFY